MEVDVREGVEVGVVEAEEEPVEEDDGDIVVVGVGWDNTKRVKRRRKAREKSFDIQIGRAHV